MARVEGDAGVHPRARSALPDGLPSAGPSWRHAPAGDRPALDPPPRDAGIPLPRSPHTPAGGHPAGVTACRYPAEDPASDAFAFLQITDMRGEEQVFQGWMIASSPALNALDHPRYDVWVMSCR